MHLTVGVVVLALVVPLGDEQDRRVIARLKAAGADVAEVDDPETGPGLAVDFQAKIQDEALQPLFHLKRLVALRILGGGVTDQGLKSLEPLTGLRLLVVDAESVTNKGLQSVGKLTGLVKLDVMKAQLSSAGLAHLKGLKSLRRLFLYGAKITEKDVTPLQAMTWLKYIDLPSTVSEAAVTRLRERLPNTQIHRWRE